MRVPEEEGKSGGLNNAKRFYRFQLYFVILDKIANLL